MAADWREQAACRGKEGFTGIGIWLTRENLAARALCDICPVRVDCDTEYQDTDPTLRTSVIAAGKVYDSHGQVRRSVARLRTPRVETSRVCAAHDCTANLAGTHGRTQYCSEQCRQRASRRREALRYLAGVA